MGFRKPGIIRTKINELVHTEPLGTIIWGLYWILFFSIVPFISIPYIVIRTIQRLLLYYNSNSNSNNSTTNTSTTKLYHPNNYPEYDLGIFITGCDTGFGKDLAIYAANAGYTVFAGCLNEVKSKEQFSTFTKIYTIQCNVTNNNECINSSTIVNEWLKDINNTKPRTDIGRTRILFAIINNAGIGTSGETDECDLSEFEHSMNINCYGQIRIVKSFLPLLKEQAIFLKQQQQQQQQNKNISTINIRILNMVSVAGITNGGPRMITYHVSKHAAQSFTCNLRLELLKSFNIYVSSINPSFHTTPLVTNLNDTIKKKKTSLSNELHTQYGTEYHEKRINNLMEYATAWDPRIVVEQIMECGLLAQCPLPEIIIGIDSKYVFSLIRMLPSYVWQPILLYLSPIPACMKDEEEKNKK